LNLSTADSSIASHSAPSFELRFHHAGVSVPDLEASIAWYKKMLGFDLERRDSLPPLQAKVAFLRRGDLAFELFEVPGAAPLPEDRRVPNKDLLTHGNKHVAFAVKDVRAAVEELKERGADIVFVLDIGGGTVSFIRDNSGNLIELFQQPGI
jgi:methylmalonyl-CoA/ethylmalonyl-CoA epimerase